MKQVPCSFYARTPGERRTLLAMPALYPGLLPGVFRFQGHDCRLCHPPGKEEGQTQRKVAGLFCRTFAAVRGRPATKAFVPGVSPAKLRAEPVPTLPWAYRRFQTAKVWENGPPVNGLSPKTTTGPGNQKERRCQPEKRLTAPFLASQRGFEPPAPRLGVRRTIS